MYVARHWLNIILSNPQNDSLRKQSVGQRHRRRNRCPRLCNSPAEGLPDSTLTLPSAGANTHMHTQAHTAEPFRWLRPGPNPSHAPSWSPHSNSMRQNSYSSHVTDKETETWGGREVRRLRLHSSLMAEPRPQPEWNPDPGRSPSPFRPPSWVH